jgi:hypothetical protein
LFLERREKERERKRRRRRRKVKKKKKGEENVEVRSILYVISITELKSEKI